MDQQFEHSCCLNVSLSHSGFTIRVITPVLDCQYSTLQYSQSFSWSHCWIHVIGICTAVWLSVSHIEDQQRKYSSYMTVHQSHGRKAVGLQPLFAHQGATSCCCCCSSSVILWLAYLLLCLRLSMCWANWFSPFTVTLHMLQ